MKRGLFALMLLCQLVGLPFYGYPQAGSTDAKRQQTLEINGRFFVIHRVARGESLYGISRQYGISLGEIAKYNPDVYYGIKVGDVLRIPALPPQKEGSAEEYQLHIVQDGETLYSLARRYGVTVAALQRFNGLTSDNLPQNAVLRIPRPGADERGDWGKESQEAGEWYEVRSGETLHALAARFGVSVDRIKQRNALTSDFLSSGQKIFIPSSSRREATDSCEKLHAVNLGESWYRIAKEYGVSVEDLQRVNPTLAVQGLQVDKFVCIPKATPSKEHRSALTPDLPSTGKNFFISPSSRTEATDSCVKLHRVDRGESLYRIAKKYGVSVEDLQRVNPTLTVQGLQVDNLLCIPRVTSNGSQPIQAVRQGEGVIVGELIERAPTVYCDSLHGYPKGRTLRCALMLPFSLEELGADSLKVATAARKALPTGMAVSYDARFLSFYKGTLLALEQFKQAGYSVALNVLDTRNSPARVRSILASDTLRNADIIIGPVYPQNISIVSAYAASRRMTMVSPLSGATPSFEMNPFLFQANPSFRTQLRQMANSIELSDSTNVVLLREEASGEDSPSSVLHLILESRMASLPSGAGVRYSVVDCSPADASATISRRIEQHMVQDRRNLVVIASNSEPLVSALLGQLAGVMRVGKYRVEVYGMPQWLKMRKLDFGQLLALNAHVVSPYYVNYDDSRVCDFVTRYREAYLEEPSQFAFQGYDIAVYFLRAIFKFGIDFRYCIDKVENWQLQNTFDFKQSRDFSTFESEGVFMLRFDKRGGLVREYGPNGR